MSKRSIGSDLAKVDAHVIQPHEYEEIPEVDEAFLDRAERLGLVRYYPNNRAAAPKGDAPKPPASLPPARR